MRALWLFNQLWVIVTINPRRDRASSEARKGFLHQSSHGFATRVHGFATKTKALAREIPPATQARNIRLELFLFPSDLLCRLEKDILYGLVKKDI